MPKDQPVSAISDETLRRLAPLQSGVIVDAMGRIGISGCMDDVVPLSLGQRIAGRARTLEYAPVSGVKRTGADLYSIIRDCRPGDVLVMATGATKSWLFGENVAHLALYQQLAGLITDGRIRDSAEIAAMEIGIFAGGVATRPHAPFLEIVAVDRPIVCGGAQVLPGDLVFGDADGIVVTPRAAVESVLIEAEDLNALEEEQARAIEERASLDAIAEIIGRKKLRKT